VFAGGVVDIFPDNLEATMGGILPELPQLGFGILPRVVRRDTSVDGGAPGCDRHAGSFSVTEVKGIFWSHLLYQKGNPFYPTHNRLIILSFSITNVDDFTIPFLAHDLLWACAG
jgi:hypothetical protein